MSGFSFTSSHAYRYRKGRLYLGVTPILRRSIGIETERHAITVAGAGAGKGSCIIIPNLLRWPHNALVIDPKGEAAEATWKARKKGGRAVHVIDPFKVANVPDNLRASFNPLSSVDVNSFTVREDIEVIADGLVKRSDPKHAQWDDGAVTLLAGIMAYILLEGKEESHTLKTIRKILLQSRDDLYADAQEMMKCDGMGGLARAAGSILMTAFENVKSIEVDIVGAAKRHTSWIDTDPMTDVLDKSSFQLTDLRSKHATVFLVLPPIYINSHATFLRLFVRCALDAMGRQNKGESLRNKQCLFILDEFFTLGKIDQITKAAGLMRGWGLQLWPILQDLGQLYTLYGREGADTFFGNSDAQIFFGNTDQTTLEYVSRAIGNKSNNGMWREDMENVGQPLMTPREIRAHVAKKQKDKVARRMIAFTQGKDVLSVRLRPYFK